MSVEEFERICRKFFFVRDVVYASKYNEYTVYFISMFSANKDSIDEWKRQWSDINSLLIEYKNKLPLISFNIYQIVVQGEG